MASNQSASRRQRRALPSRRRIAFWVLVAVILLGAHDYRPDYIAVAIAPFEFDLLTWELANLPDKWVQRLKKYPGAFVDSSPDPLRFQTLREYFANGRRLREIDHLLIRRQATGAGADSSLLAEQYTLRERQESIRPEIEETLESVVAESLQELGFRSWQGVFPPVDAALTGSPTVLVLSPRDRILRHDGGVLNPGLNTEDRNRIESHVESTTDLSALVVNTGGIAFYPSIVSETSAYEYAVETVAHEWIHHWLWWRPLGRRYFKSVAMTTINETVATIAAAEIAPLALARIGEDQANLARPPSHTHGNAEPHRHAERRPFDFQGEMRATRLEVDRLLAAGDVDGAEAYLEERRLVFVEHGYPIRRLNQAYFAFHGTYGTTGAAGVSVIAEQVLEIRRNSPTLRDFLLTTAQFKTADQLADYVNGTGPPPLPHRLPVNQ